MKTGNHINIGPKIQSFRSTLGEPIIKSIKRSVWNPVLEFMLDNEIVSLSHDLNYYGNW